jgi:hypothetical protein
MRRLVRRSVRGGARFPDLVPNFEGKKEIPMTNATPQPQPRVLARTVAEPLSRTGKSASRTFTRGIDPIDYDLD